MRVESSLKNMYQHNEKCRIFKCGVRGRGIFEESLRNLSVSKESLRNLSVSLSLEGISKESVSVFKESLRNLSLSLRSL